MSRELFKSMVYKDNKVYTSQCSNNVNPKNYDREENKGLTRLYQEKGQEDFEKYFLTNLILEGNVEILSGCNNTLRRLNYLANLLWKNKEFIKLRNKEDEIFRKSLNTKTEEEKTAQQTNAEAEAENAVTPEVQDTDDNYSVPRGTCGTVEYVDDEGQIGMKWDNGSSLSLIYGVDSFELITNKELNHNFKKNKDERGR